MFNHILLPVDLTDKNTPAIEVAKTLIDAAEGTITILHVIELLDAPMEELQDFYQELEERARSKSDMANIPLHSALPFIRVLLGDRFAQPRC